MPSTHHPPTHPLTASTTTHPLAPRPRADSYLRIMSGLKVFFAVAWLRKATPTILLTMGKNKREEEQKKGDASDSEDELVRRISALQCREENHYACFACSKIYTGNHDWTWDWDYTQHRYVHYCVRCQQLWTQAPPDASNCNITQPMPSTTAACASDSACASAQPGEATQAQEPQPGQTIDATTVPVPDDECDTIEMETETEQDKNDAETETKDKNDADKSS